MFLSWAPSIQSASGSRTRPSTTRLFSFPLIPQLTTPFAELAKYALFPGKGSRAGAPGYANTDYRVPEDHSAWLRRAGQSLSLLAHMTAEGLRNAAAHRQIRAERQRPHGREELLDHRDRSRPASATIA